MRKRAFALLLICLTLCGCAAGDAAAHTKTVFAMDTVMNLTAYGTSGETALAAAEKELYRLDALLARGREGSAVCRLNEQGEADDETVAYLLRVSAEIAAATDGAFDPTVAPVLALWGFGSGATEHRVPSETELSQALARVGAEQIRVDGTRVTLSGGEADLGGVAKGWAGLRAREILAQNGVESAVIDLGGDVGLLGKKPDGSLWRVAIRDPAAEDAFLGVLEAADVFVMTSGVYERYFEENGTRWHHIIDPKTGYPAQSGLVSATIVCADGVWADALATAACVLGAERTLRLRESLAARMPFDCILVTDDARVLYTCSGFAGETGNGYAYEQVS